MNITVIKTEKITSKKASLTGILDHAVSVFNERNILVVTSKIVSLCEGAVVKVGQKSKKDLITREADYFLPDEISKYDITLAIKNNILIPSAGIDESNGNGYYILWPKYPQKTANMIREYLCKRFSVRYAGVIITDSKTTPLRWGTTGTAIAHSGFSALNNYIGTPDIFGRKLKYTKANIADGLAAAAVVSMGEGNEQTPLAVMRDVPFVQFQARNPTEKELEDLKIDIQDDLYAPLLTRVKWKKSSKA
jgi:putative folate metabolism gamma-glutamate ligase